MSLIAAGIGLDKELAVPYEELVRILSAPSHSRTAEELKTLATYFNNIKFFADCRTVLKPDQYNRILKAIEFEKVDRNQFLFHKGDRGNKFYVILKGHTNVVIPRPQGAPLKVTKAFQKHAVRVLQFLAKGGKAGLAASKLGFEESQPELSPKRNLNLRRKNLDSSVSPMKLSQAIELVKENINNEKIEEADADRLKEKFEAIKEMDHPPLKITKARAIIGFFLTKTWLEEARTKKEVEKGALDLQTLNRYKSKLYWHNLFFQGLRCLDQEFFQNILPGQMKVFQYSTGGYFGEIAILGNGLRAAGIYCDEDSDFAVISKKYEDDFLFLYRAQNKEKESLLRTFSPFNWWIERDKVKAFFHYLKKFEHFTRGNLVFQKGALDSLRRRRPRHLPARSRGTRAPAAQAEKHRRSEPGRPPVAQRPPVPVPQGHRRSLPLRRRGAGGRPAEKKTHLRRDGQVAHLMFLPLASRGSSC